MIKTENRGKKEIIVTTLRHLVRLGVVGLGRSWEAWISGGGEDSGGLEGQRQVTEEDKYDY